MPTATARRPTVSGYSFPPPPDRYLGRDLHACYAQLADGRRIAVTAPADYRGACAVWDRLAGDPGNVLRHKPDGAPVAWLAVRSMDDPNWPAADAARLSHLDTIVAAYSPTGYTTRLAAVRKAGHARGYVGRPGGWIYTRTGRVVTQGWEQLTGALGVAQLDGRWHYRVDTIPRTATPKEIR